MSKELLLIECKHGECVWEAAERAGYAPPLFRVGVVVDAKPGDGEEIVAWVSAGRHSVPLPVFGKGDGWEQVTEEEFNEVKAGRQDDD